MAQIDVGQKAEAERSLLHLIQAAPNFVAGYLNLGLLYGRNGDFDRALEVLEKALTIDRENSIVHLNIGDVLIKKREFGRAIESYKRAIDLRPEENASASAKPTSAISGSVNTAEAALS